MAEDAKPTSNKIQWNAPEYLHYPKGGWWYAIISLLALAIVGYFAYSRDFLTATLFLALAGLLIFFARKSPRNLEIELGPGGLKINAFRIPYHEIKTFWVVYEPPEIKTLNFETTATLNRYLTLQLGNEDPVAIRKFLLEYMVEDLERGEHFTDRISRALKL